MCAPIVEKDSTRPQHFRTIRKSTPQMCSGNVRSAPRSSKLAAFSWSISDLFISTHLKVLLRWVWQLRTCFTRTCFQVTSNSVLFSYKKYANLVAPKTEEKVSTKCFYCEVSCCKDHPSILLIFLHNWSITGLWKSIFVQTSTSKSHEWGAWWTEDFSLQVILGFYFCIHLQDRHFSQMWSFQIKYLLSMTTCCAHKASCRSCEQLFNSCDQLKTHACKSSENENYKERGGNCETGAQESREELEAGAGERRISDISGEAGYQQSSEKDNLHSGDGRQIIAPGKEGETVQSQGGRLESNRFYQADEGQKPPDNHRWITLIILHSWCLNNFIQDFSGRMLGKRQTC